MLVHEFIDVVRPDIAANYADVAGAEQSGFHTWLSVAGSSSQEWLVQAVLEDHSRVALARIRARRRWRESSADRAAPLVSVIIPCYNQAHFLGEAIDSVLAQSYPNFEIIVVDDGSTDNTSEVAGSYAGLRCIRQVNQGLAAARNAGLGQSNGEYLVFLDADDRLLPEALERGLACFEAHPECALVAGHYRRIGADGSPLEEVPLTSVECEHYSELLQRCYIAVPATVLYRRRTLEVVGDFDQAVNPCADYDLYLRIARQLPIHCYDQVVAEYRHHGANMTNNPALMLDAVLTVLRRQWSHVQGNASYEEAYKAGLKFWQGYYGAQIAARRRNNLTTSEILEVSLCEPNDEQLWGCNLEAPQTGIQDNSDMIVVIGWVVGRKAPAIAIEIISKGRVCHRAPLNVNRRDVTAQYPKVGDRRTGFQTWMQVVGLSDHEWLVQAVLEDHSRVALARIRARRRWRESSTDRAAPLVSVIIPCYNQAHFLGEAIDSVLAQSYPNFEIIVVDDGSTDNTSEVAESYAGVQCIRQTNQRQAAARNAGLGQSNGEYLVFLDADDRLLPEALERGLACFEAHPECALVAGHYRRIGADGSPLEEMPLPLVEREYYTEFLRRNCIAVPATVMYRRSAFEAVGDFYNEVVPCEDYDLYLRIARQLPIYCYEHVVAEYRQHGANVTRDPASMLEAALTVLRRQWPYVQGNASFRKAYIIGWRVWQDYYGEQLVGAIVTQALLREWKVVMEDFSVLLRYYPRGLISLMFNYSLRGRIREIVRTALPPNASVVVVNTANC